MKCRHKIKERPKPEPMNPDQEFRELLELDHCYLRLRAEVFARHAIIRDRINEIQAERAVRRIQG